MSKNELIEKFKKNPSFTKNYFKNQIIFNEKDLCNQIGIVVKGSVKISSFTQNGKEIIYNIIDKENMFGHSLIFSSFPFYKGTITALNDTEIIFINKEDLINILFKEDILRKYLNYLSDTILVAKDKTRLLSFSDIKDRILYYISINGYINYTSITSLAKNLCVTREALSRALKRLVNEQIIFIEGKCIKLIK